MSDMVNEIYPKWSPYVIFKHLLLRNFWTNDSLIKEVTQPVLVMSAAKDFEVPPWMSKQLYENAERSEYKELKSFAHATHDVNWKQPDYISTMKKFVDKVCHNGANSR